jgi:hypothetical protein
MPVYWPSGTGETDRYYRRKAFGIYTVIVFLSLGIVAAGITYVYKYNNDIDSETTYHGTKATMSIKSKRVNYIVDSCVGSLDVTFNDNKNCTVWFPFHPFSDCQKASDDIDSYTVDTKIVGYYELKDNKLVCTPTQTVITINSKNEKFNVAMITLLSVGCTLLFFGTVWLWYYGRKHCLW